MSCVYAKGYPSSAGASRHQRLGEAVCGECAAERQAYRRGVRDGEIVSRRKADAVRDIWHEPTCELASGRASAAGYKKHRYRGEKPCEECLLEYRAYTNNVVRSPERRDDDKKRPRRPKPKQRKQTYEEFAAQFQTELEHVIPRILCIGFGCLEHVERDGELCGRCRARNHVAPPWRGGPELAYCHAVYRQPDEAWDRCGNLRTNLGFCADHQDQIGVQQRGMPHPSVVATT